MGKEFETPEGRIEVAWDELALFFNNNTIKYGLDAYTIGMTKNEFRRALEAKGFDEGFAELFVKKYWWTVDEGRKDE